MKKTNMKAMAIATASILSVSMMGAMSSSSATKATSSAQNIITNDETDGTDVITANIDSTTNAKTNITYYATDGTGNDTSDMDAYYTISVPATVDMGTAGNIKMEGTLIAGKTVTLGLANGGTFTMSNDKDSTTLNAKAALGGSYVLTGINAATPAVTVNGTVTARWDPTIPQIGTWTGCFKYSVTLGDSTT